jgi:hypothetical protein
MLVETGKKIKSNPSTKWKKLNPIILTFISAGNRIPVTVTLKDQVLLITLH